MAIAPRNLLLLVAAFTAALGLTLIHPAVGQADSGCDLYVAPTGDDDASGTSSDPLGSPQGLLDELASGQVGCFMDGTFDSYDEQVKVTEPGITLTSAPGARAVVIGRLWIAEGADGVTVSHLDLNGRNSAGQPGPTVNAAGTVFEDVDVTNDHTHICFILGSAEWGVADGTVIQNSRIHDCGVLPATNKDHGIYVEDSRDVVIRDNWIYDNADRGIQLYPNAIGTHIYRNVIDGNGQGVIFSGEGEQSSSGNVVENNVISNSRTRWNAESYWGDAVGTGNVLRDNCIWSSNRDGYYNQSGGVQPASAGASGFSARDNVIAEPKFVNRTEGDLTLQADSPCTFTEGVEKVGRVTLKKQEPVVVGDAPVLLTGQASGASGRVVTILKWKKGAWRKFAKRTLRRDGSFTVRKRLGGRKIARLRAMVPGATISRTVRVPVKGDA
jgi:parallel beta-helix repeat protein